MKRTISLAFISCSFLALFVFFSCRENFSDNFGNAVVMGEIVSQADGSPIPGARIELCFQEVMMLKEGLFIGGINCDSADRVVQTDEEGIFEIMLNADTTGLPTYVWLRVSHPDYEVKHEMYVHVGKGGNSLGMLPLRPSGNPLDVAATPKSSRLIVPRSPYIFTHSVKSLRNVFPANSLDLLPSVSDVFPEGNYARFYQPIRGYNTIPENFSLKKWDTWETIIIPMDAAMAGVTEGEVGEFTDHPEALKTQVIWARTYALYKGLMFRMPQNHQMAFRSWVSDRVLQASRETSGMILTHPDAPGGEGYPLMAVYSAQCNGDFTQSGRLAKWSGCKVGGTWVPYLIAIECSKHPNCYQTGSNSQSCCNVDPEWQRYVYGHGAGGCQHGMRDFAEGNFPNGKQGLPHTVIAPYYFYGSSLIQFHQDVWLMKKPSARPKLALNEE